METETVKTVKHTELPWIVSPYGYPFEKSCPALIWSQKTVNGNQKHIANVLDRIPYHGTNEIGYHLISVEEKNANAEFIVRACNSHYELLEALKLVEKFFTERPSVIWPDIKGGESKMADLVMSAIKKATS